ncbi:MAG: hypothetical protein Ct9H300mP14_14870 [Gammaproteobacteria bacterium]|nr:MAG: hypothetical protein Ct9H300mP14_14870 [Gammaproteobacteria bacterium]
MRACCALLKPPARLGYHEQAGAFSGYYLVLMGHLSPLDGIGPDDLAVQPLFKKFCRTPQIQEVILATNLTVEGEATADYLSDLMGYPRFRLVVWPGGFPSRR